MHLSRNVILKPQQSDGLIFGLEPKKFFHHVPQNMIDSAHQGMSSKAFAINELVAKTSGLAELHRQNQQDLVETEVIRRLKEVEEKAYAEAHKLGMIDGTKQAFDGTTELINKSLEKFAEVFVFFEKTKEQLFLENEESFIKLIFKISESVIMKSIQLDPTIIATVLKKAIDDTQGEEEITVRLSQEDNDFLQTITESKLKPWEGNKKIRLEVSPDVSRGGCIVETNHGAIDAGIEKRVEKAWAAVEGRIPKEETE